MDAANVDLKAFTEEFYHRLCFAELQPVLDTLVFLHRETPVWLEVTTLLIPGENDSVDELDRASDWFAANLARMCRGISPPSTPTSRCWTNHARPRHAGAGPRDGALQRIAPRLYGQHP